MNQVTINFLLLLACGFTHCFSVTANQGGNRAAHMFFCEIPGCAANVTNVFCNEKLLFSHTRIADCTGPPPLNSVCQLGGRAFVSINSDGECEFEGKDGYIDTKKCTDPDDNCPVIDATSSSVTTQEPAKHEHIIGGVIGPKCLSFKCGQSGGLALLLLFTVGLSLYCCKRRQRGEQQVTDVTVPLSEVQSPEETSERDTRGGPGFDDGSSPSQHDPGA